jgi:ribosomal protein L37E
MNHKCPNCQRVLYNRRLKACGFCGAPIPEDLRFSPEECATLDRKMAELEEHRRQRELDAAKEDKQRDDGEPGLDFTGFLS